MNNEAQLLSVVIPVYFEEQVIDEFYLRLKAVLAGLKPRYRHELIFINDGSGDSSLEILRGLSKKDPCLRVISLSRNFGHQIAITAGINHASGDAVVVIDGDLQDPPEVIASMVDLWENGHSVVYGIREEREGDNFFKRFTAKVFYRLIGWLSSYHLPPDSGDFRLMDRAVVDVLKEMTEESRYLRGMISWVGFSQIGLGYKRDARYAGNTKYTLQKMIKFALDGLVSFSDKPLRLSSHFGLLMTLTSFIAIIALVVNKVVNPEATMVGWTSLLVIILFLGGIQLISIGVLGEYIARIFHETKQRPLYVIAEKYGFADEGADEQIEETPKVADLTE